jgi:hypothetical protein
MVAETLVPVATMEPAASGASCQPLPRSPSSLKATVEVPPQGADFSKVLYSDYLVSLGEGRTRGKLPRLTEGTVLVIPLDGSWEGYAQVTRDEHPLADMVFFDFKLPRDSAPDLAGVVASPAAVMGHVILPGQWVRLGWWRSIGQAPVPSGIPPWPDLSSQSTMRLQHVYEGFFKLRELGPNELREFLFDRVVEAHRRVNSSKP